VLDMLETLEKECVVDEDDRNYKKIGTEEETWRYRLSAGKMPFPNIIQ
jgi:hypothetical protein